MLQEIVYELLRQVRRKEFPKKLIMNYIDYRILVHELESQDFDSLFTLKIVIVKNITKFKIV